jgi:hypothetical protein
MKSLTEITEQLSRVDLKKTSDTELLGIMRQIPRLGMVGFELQPGQPILRTRTWGGEFPTQWRRERDISYNPDPTNAAYGRASLQGVSVFYGCVGMREQFEEARMLSIYEVNEIMWTPNYAYEEEYALVGNWHVNHPVNVVAIVQADQYHTKNELLRAQFERYLHALDHAKMDKEGCIKLSGFLAHEFAKEVMRQNDWQYKISAAFSHWAMEAGLDGVAYPSARAQGEAKPYNVALKPTTIEESCRLVAVYGYRLIKEDENTLIPYPFLGDTDVQDTFNWQDPGPLLRLDLIRDELRRKRQMGRDSYRKKEA